MGKYKHAGKPPMTDEEIEAFELTLPPAQKERFAEYEALMEAVGDCVKEFVAGKLAPIETRLAGAADAGKLNDLAERVSALHGKLDKILQTQSAQAKHLQSLERKYGELGGRARAS